jgi:hypothetical protein
MGAKIMDSYLQAIMLGLGAGLTTGTMIFIFSWGIRKVLTIMEIAL